MNHGIKSIAAEMVHPYFTASPLFPDDIQGAWEDGKKRCTTALQTKISAVEELTLDEYCNFTGSEINQ